MGARAATGPVLGAAAPRPAADRLAVAVLMLDAERDARYVNRAWVELSGLDLEASRDGGWARGLRAHDRDRLRDTLREGSGVVDCTLDGPGGRHWTRWLWQEQPGEPSDSRVVSVVDLSSDRSRMDQLVEQASQDPLTQVANRRAFLEQLRAALRSGGDEHVGVVYLDLDGFKQVNDSGGHALGDSLLRLVAQRLRRHLRSGDVLGRVGGDEFAVLCHGPKWELMSVAGRVRSALLEPFHLDATTLTVSAAVGVAFAEGPSDDPETLLSRADSAMYRAKNHCPRGEAAAPAPEVWGDAPGAVRLPQTTADMVVRRLRATSRALAPQGEAPPTADEQRLELAIREIEALVRDLQSALPAPRSETA